jgi:hypothetical protein
VLGVMSALRLPDEVAKHAGLTMVQAASIASVLEVGELICPFIVVTKGPNRQSIEFESGTQDEAVSKGWSSLEEMKDKVDLWAFAREGLSTRDGEKIDVLVVAAWAAPMDEPAIFVQPFLPKGKGGFALIGPMEVQDLPDSEMPRIAQSFSEGIDEHPKGNKWTGWRRG